MLPYGQHLPTISLSLLAQKAKWQLAEVAFPRPLRSVHHCPGEGDIPAQGIRLA